MKLNDINSLVISSLKFSMKENVKSLKIPGDFGFLIFASSDKSSNINTYELSLIALFGSLHALTITLRAISKIVIPPSTFSSIIFGYMIHIEVINRMFYTTSSSIYSIASSSIYFKT